MSLRLASLLLAAWLTPQGLGAAAFSQPLVDVAPNTTGISSMIAVWSSTNAYVTPNVRVNVIFPPDISVPVGLNPAACQCIFLRHTSTSAGAWAASEVTFTAGTYGGSGSMVSLSLPAALHPGKFFIRFDRTAGFSNPSTVGLATLALVDPDGNTTLSRGFYIRSTSTAAAAMGSISGTVKTTSGKALPGALVLASSDGSFLPISISARKQWVSPRPTSSNAYTTAAGSDGGYNLSLPPGTYSIKAEVWRHKGGVAQSSESAVDSGLTVNSGATTAKSFSLTPLP